MLHLGVCDDDQAFKRQIISMVSKVYENQFSLHDFSSGGELLFCLESRESILDIILLDIRMPFINGIETAKRIREFNRQVVIIFLTEHREYVWNGYDVQAFHFIPKLEWEIKLPSVMNKAITEAQRIIRDSMLIETKFYCVRIPFSEIIFIESNDRVLTVHTQDYQQYKYYKKLSVLAGELLSHGFYLISRSTLINYSHIKYIDRKLGCVLLTNGYQIPIARKKIKPLLSQMQQWFLV